MMSFLRQMKVSRGRDIASVVLVKRFTDDLVEAGIVQSISELPTSGRLTGVKSSQQYVGSVNSDKMPTNMSSRPFLMMAYSLTSQSSLQTAITKELLNKATFLPAFTFHSNVLSFREKEYFMITEGNTYGDRETKFLLKGDKPIIADNFPALSGRKVKFKRYHQTN